MTLRLRFDRQLDKDLADVVSVGLWEILDDLEPVPKERLNPSPRRDLLMAASLVKAVAVITHDPILARTIAGMQDQVTEVLLLQLRLDAITASV